jgi:acetyl-CoA acetyltransferase
MARVEINEAFAVQVLAVLKADWCDDAKLNVSGSGISLGTPSEPLECGS